MSKALASILGRKTRIVPAPSDEFILATQLTGIEVEIDWGQQRAPDSSIIQRMLSTDWNLTADGSLRNGYECVLSAPMYGKQLAHAIDRLYEVVSPPVSSLASTHIHIDMQEEETTLDTLRGVVLLCYCMEEAIYALSSGARKYCNYAVPLTMQNREILRTVLDPSVPEVDVGSVLTRMRSRYFGLNLAALGKYGSIEFRYFETARNAEQLKQFVNVCHAIKLLASSHSYEELYSVLLRSPSEYEYKIKSTFGSVSDHMLRYAPYEHVSKMLASLHLHYSQAVSGNSVFNTAISEEYISKFGGTKKERKKLFDEDAWATLNDLANGQVSNRRRRAPNTVSLNSDQAQELLDRLSGV